MPMLENLLGFVQQCVEWRAEDGDFDRLFCDCLLKDAQAQAASIWRLDNLGFLRLQWGTNVHEESSGKEAPTDAIVLRLGEGITGAAALSRSPISVFDAQAIAQHDARVDRTIGFATRAMVSAPIVSQGQCLGAVNILNPVDGGRFDAQWKDLLLIAATLYGTACCGKAEVHTARVNSASGRSRRSHSPAASREKTTVVGISPAIREALATCLRVADSDVPVLVLGETGTGKELAARRLHEESPRSGMPLVAVNCAALAENLLESELFGHVKGAFTGAESSRKGRFATAHGGTIFLDEIADMSPAAQAKLLRVLQEKKAAPVGSDKEYDCDVRIVAATNCDLWRRVQEGRFREDLYFRVAGVEVTLPPLRQRREDIPLLARYFLEEEAGSSGRNAAKALSAEAESVIQGAAWPGNVRQLRESLRAAAAIAEDDTIRPGDLPASMRKTAGGVAESLPVSSDGGAPDASLRGKYIEALDANRFPGTGRYNIAAAARDLGMPRKTLAYQLRKMGLI